MSTSTTSQITKRPWVRFRLRTVLVLTTLLCIWLGMKAKYAHDQRVAVAAIRAVGGEVHYDYQYDADGLYQEKATPWASAWLLDAIGEDYFITVVDVGFLTSPTRGGGTYTYNTKVTDATLRELIPLKRLRYLSVRSIQVTDDGLETIGEMPGLESLQLSCPRVTDVGVAHLAQLDRLKLLSLTSPKVSDTAMPYVAEINTLESLELRGGQITDDGLIPLRNLPSLRTLTLYGTTSFGVAGTQIMGTGLQHVGALKQLEVLWINNMELHAGDVAHLEQLSRLKSAHFFMTSVPTEGLERLQQALPNANLQASGGGTAYFRSP